MAGGGWRVGGGRTCQTSFSVTYSMSGPHSHCAWLGLGSGLGSGSGSGSGLGVGAGLGLGLGLDWLSCAFGQLWLAQVVLHHRSLAYCPPGLPLSTVLKHCAATSLMPLGTVLSVSTSGTTVAAPSSLMSMGPSRPGTW